jgi:hypothetical protein
MGRLLRVEYREDDTGVSIPTNGLAEGLTAGTYSRDMTTDRLPTGPDPEAIKRTILETWPETDLAEAMGAMFFSLDPDKHFPNFATIVTTDEHDEGAPSDLTRPGLFRLNIGVGRQTFERLVGSIGEPDYAAVDTVFPHPVYARQLWISIINPSDETFRDTVVPLLTEAHDRLAAARTRHDAGDATS